jgi:hypothetical protein
MTGEAEIVDHGDFWPNQGPGRVMISDHESVPPITRAYRCSERVSLWWLGWAHSRSAVVVQKGPNGWMCLSMRRAWLVGRISIGRMKRVGSMLRIWLTKGRL